MKLLNKLFSFFKPCIIQFEDGLYGVRVYGNYEDEFWPKFLYVDFRSNMNCLPSTKKIKHSNFDECKTEDLNTAIKWLAQIQFLQNKLSQEEKAKKRRKKYTVITYAGEKNESAK